MTPVGDGVSTSGQNTGSLKYDPFMQFKPRQYKSAGSESVQAKPGLSRAVSEQAW